jgi:hypothetical protein
MSTKTVEETRNIKERMLSEIRKITFPKHPRGEEFVAKFSQYNDCFGIGYRAEADACRSCVLLAMYEGKEFPVNDLCKKFMELPLFETLKTEKEKAPMSEEEKKDAKETAAEKPVKEKKEKAPKAPKEKKVKVEGEASVSKEERRAQITAAIKKGAVSLPALIALPEFKNVSVNYFLHTMVKEGLVTREKQGHGYVYGIK